MNRLHRLVPVWAILTLSLAGHVTPSAAAPITFTGSSGSLSASATFTVVGSNLQVVLTNTGASDAMVPTDVLTAIFFDITGTPLLTAVSATSGGTTYTLNVGGPPITVSLVGTDIGGAWAYEEGTPAHGALYGIGAAGFSNFGPPDVFPGPNVDSDPGVDGVGYGLLPAGDNLMTGNGGLNNRQFTKNSDTFLLGLGSLASTFDPSASIHNLTFQYGTSLTETTILGVPPPPRVTPEPVTLVLLGMGFLAFGVSRRAGRK
jgi:hypothetical protein